MEFNVGDKVRRLPEYQGAGGWDRGGEVMVVTGFTYSGWIQLHDYPGAVAPHRFELVGFSGLARDRLYADLREQGASHAAALDFLKKVKDAEDIIRAYRDAESTGSVFARLVVWSNLPQGTAYWAAIAKRAGW